MTDKITEARRVAFEAFAVEAFGHGSIEMDGDGDYFWESTRNAFDVWRAAIDSVCVELPKVIRGGAWGGLDSYEMDSTIEAIEQAGVRCK